MSYQGQVFTIPLGGLGLMTDDVQGRLPLGSLTMAENVELTDGVLEKCGGAWRWNRSVEASAIRAVFDFWPDEVRQRVFTVTQDGLVRRWADREAVITVSPSGSAPTTLALAEERRPVFVPGGAESAGRNRKLFLFTGTNPVQVISGDGVTRSNLSAPAADWTSSYPSAGLVHRSRLVTWGNLNDPHRIYLSDPDDHETFTGGDFLQFSVYPGEGEGILAGHVFKGRLFLFKYPTGVYVLDDSAVDVADWAIRKLNSTFGAASVFSAFQAIDDLYVANATGTVTSLSATAKFGDVESGDLFINLGNASYIDEQISNSGTRDRSAIYYEKRKRALVAFRSSGGIRNDRIAVIDFQKPSMPRVTWLSAFQPSCLGLMKDTTGIPRPIYGADDGYIYRMDWATREVEDENAIDARFATPPIDGGQADPGLAEKNKLFDFLEVTFEETGAWNLDVDVYIDSRFSETISFVLDKGTHLGEFPLAPGPSIPGIAVGRTEQSFRKPLHGTGRRIQFVARNSGLRQNFRITSLRFYFRIAGETQTE